MSGLWAVLAICWASSDSSLPTPANRVGEAVENRPATSADACPDEVDLRAKLAARRWFHDEQYTDSSLRAVHESLDDLAMAKLCATVDIEPAELQAWLAATPGVERYRLETRWLRPGELLVLWGSTASYARGSGGRATVFTREVGGWKKTGYMDFDDIWSPYFLASRPDGLVLLTAQSNGNGWPPVRLVALAVDRGRLLTYISEDLPGVAMDANNGVQISRRAKHTNWFSSEPLLRYSVDIVRAEHRLLVTERLLTPWVLAFDAFCGGDRSIPLPHLLAPADDEWGQYPGRLTAAFCSQAHDLRASQIEAQVKVYEAEINWVSRPATLTLRLHDGRWRIVAVEYACTYRQTAGNRFMQSELDGSRSENGACRIVSTQLGGLPTLSSCPGGLRFGCRDSVTVCGTQL